MLAATLGAGCGRIGFGATRSGSVDAPAGDTVAPDGGPGCAGGYRLCDGFETGILDPVWTLGPGVSRDTTVGHRGTSSIHAHMPPLAIGTDGYAYLAQFSTLPLGDPTFYVRAWVLVSHLPTNNMEVIAAQPTSGPPNEDGLFVESGALAVYTQYANRSKTTAMPPPAGVWFCVLWTVARDSGNAGSLTVAGELPTITLANVQTDGTPPMTEMDFGIGFSGSTVAVPEPAMDVHIDDVIVASSPVTCAD